ncbi:MAG TPA: sulfite exporter TauE/SafE family protein [Oscillospiraceae bacterium]|nr:sulfite exporter TauE/SafE family protein [Oscillospiraceae bacterium]HPF55064.1 sulfite exporter TauE/SafE family protein [Clostridiales bacterium]HPK34881.1 sulfite exporter TauE/SafE family protein [Oscillospiraceae bacterium]HPR76155.1 sulfite exporter TauE/SafE family protein [Oscillospiraceae bacterium]
MSWVWDTLAAVVAGWFAGLGFGGGWILYAYVIGFGIASGSEARGLVLLLFIPSAVISLVGHTKNGLVDWKEIWLGIPLGIAMLGLGFWLYTKADEAVLRIVLIALLSVVGLIETVGGFRMKSK